MKYGKIAAFFKTNAASYFFQTAVVCEKSKIVQLLL